MSHLLIGVPMDALQRLLQWAVMNPVLGGAVVGSLWLLSKLVGLYAGLLRPKKATR